LPKPRGQGLQIAGAGLDGKYRSNSGLRAL